MRPSTRLQVLQYTALACLLVLSAAALHAQDGVAPDGRRGQGGPGGQGMAGMQRVQGEVTAVSTTSITVKAEDGTVSTVAATENTRLMHASGEAGGQGPGAGGGRMGMGNAQPIKIADVHVGDGIMAAGMLDAPNKTLHAMFAIVTDASVVKAMKENMGKTYITGKVLAVDPDNAKMTVKRPDGVEQTIGFDESTSFRRGGGRMVRSENGAAAGATTGAPPSGESITLADIKVGDNIMGRGALKAGTFVPTQVTVMAPRPAGAAAAPAK